MITVKRQTLAICGAVVAVLSLASLTAYAGPVTAVISVQPSNKMVGLNQAFSLDIDIANVTDLYAYQFNLSFDSTILSANSVTESSFLSGGGSTFFNGGTIDNSAGTISFIFDTLLGPVPGVSGSGPLVNVSFASLASGTSPITISNVSLLDSNLNSIDANVANGTVTVSSGANGVPDRGTSALLLGIGLAGLFVVNRRAFLRRDNAV